VAQSERPVRRTAPRRAGKATPATSGVPEADDPELADQVDAVLAATRSLVAIAARSLAPVDEIVTLSQWRVLVVVSEAGSATLNQVADGLAVHASTATRICDRLTAAGLLSRREDAHDRRYLSLTLTKKGTRLVDRVTEHRRTELAAVFAAMEPARRKRVAAAFSDFARLAGAPEHDPVWSAVAART
jgi:DNA-binding MarR family transcriptional regulator